MFFLKNFTVWFVAWFFSHQRGGSCSHVPRQLRVSARRPTFDVFTAVAASCWTLYIVGNPLWCLGSYLKKSLRLNFFLFFRCLLFRLFVAWRSQSADDLINQLIRRIQIQITLQNLLNIFAFEIFDHLWLSEYFIMTLNLSFDLFRWRGVYFLNNRNVSKIENLHRVDENCRCMVLSFFFLRNWGCLCAMVVSSYWLI